jgi:hypothetical protein
MDLVNTERKSKGLEQFVILDGACDAVVGGTTMKPQLALSILALAVAGCRIGPPPTAPEPLATENIRVEGQPAWYYSAIGGGMHDLTPPTFITYTCADKRTTIVVGWDEMPATWAPIPDRCTTPWWWASVELWNSRTHRSLTIAPTHNGRVYANLPSGQVVWATIYRVGDTLEFRTYTQLPGETFDRVTFGAGRQEPQIRQTRSAVWWGRLALGGEAVADR